MTELMTAAQMRALEQAAIDSGAVTGAELMQRAGQGVVDAIIEEWPELAEGERHAVALCGPGNNGGDGFVVARLLAEKGWQVEVLHSGDAEKLPPDARANFERWSAIGKVERLSIESVGQGSKPDLLIDALFGTGLTRAIPEVAALGLRAVRRRKDAPKARRRCRTVAIDCPSGQDCDTGQILLPAPPPDAEDDSDAALLAHQTWWQSAQRWLVMADLTVTFHAAKVGHYLGAPPMPSRKLVVADIGLADWDVTETITLQPPSADRVRLVGRWQHGHQMPGRMWPGEHLNALQAGSHKYDRGHALVLAGQSGRGGAARLAARGALRIGAGLVTVACAQDALTENAARLDAVMVRSLDSADELCDMLRDDRLSAVCLGPGLGVGEATRALVLAALERKEQLDHPSDHPDDFRRRIVLDADALTSFADDPTPLFEALHRNCVLTPHEGEFARLFPDLSQAERIRPNFSGGEGRLSKVDAARLAAGRAGCTVVLKGPDTVIASAGGSVSIHAALYDREAPWLGTAGSGDVLAGMITGLLASGHAWGAPHPIVEAAVWLHVEAARHFGPGLIAEDLPEVVPLVFRDLGL